MDDMKHVDFGVIPILSYWFLLPLQGTLCARHKVLLPTCADGERSTQVSRQINVTSGLLIVLPTHHDASDCIYKLLVMSLQIGSFYYC